MLQQRIITALVLLAIVLPALFYPGPLPFMLVVLVMMAAGAWEWGRLSGFGQGGALGMGALCLLLCGLSWWAGLAQRPLPWLWALGGGLWVLGGGALLRTGVSGWPHIPRLLRTLGGLLALWLAWLAVVQAHARGVNFLLSVLTLVWVADIGAYFSGRAFGRRKLAPAISPGKSWEGVWGGMVGVLLLALLWAWADQTWQAPVPSFYTGLRQQGWWLLLLAVVFMAAMSVVGDLVESLIKRSAGVKDSSGLLPGHGGVLDRIDALLPTLPLAMMLTEWVHV
ncbi:MAG: phosphatidate cytidylyltransferase [Comamonadaceae bacterium]|jgi:phosphatidate cytidylyltransferase|nr:phosphatidate cytidylyltransferase [Comamonadaceae bacterium]